MLSQEEYHKRTNILISLLKKLATNTFDDPEHIITQLKKIYTQDEKGENEYRHEYSQIMNLITTINNDPQMDADALIANLKGIHEYIWNLCGNKNNDSENLFLEKCVHKLQDHIDLEILRLQSVRKEASQLKDMEGIINDLNQQASKLEKEANTIKEETDKIKKRTKKIKNDMDKSTVSSITVLSIFTGIVMAFVGGFSILGSAFSNTELFETRVWLLILLMSLVGFVFFNTIFMFIYMVAKLSGKKLSVQCKAEECIRCRQCETCVKPRAFCLFCKLWKKYPYVLYVNVVLIICIIASGLCGIFLNKTVVPVNVAQEKINVSEPIDIDVNPNGKDSLAEQNMESNSKSNPTTGN